MKAVISAFLLMASTAQAGMLEEAVDLAAQDGNLWGGCATAAAQRRASGALVPYTGDFDTIVIHCLRDAKPIYEKFVTSNTHEPVTCSQFGLRLGGPMANAPLGMRAKLNDKGKFVSFAGKVVGIEDNLVFIQDSAGYSIAAIVPKDATTFRPELIEVGRSAAGFGVVESPIESVNGFGNAVLSRAVIAGCIEAPPPPARPRQ
ncbi:hypothetical protein [Nevskia ramosa]|uniref:hypothetical protein n=1 Tax=Nevskia ramosa TaxID=64002 RepID=UPI003D142EFA